MSTLVALQNTLETIFAPLLTSNGGPCKEIRSLYFRSAEEIENIVKGEDNAILDVPCLILSHPVDETPIVTRDGSPTNTNCRVDSTLNYIAIFVSDNMGNDAARLVVKDTARTLFLSTAAGRVFAEAEYPTGTSLNAIYVTGARHFDLEKITGISFTFRLTMFQRVGDLT